MQAALWKHSARAFEDNVLEITKELEEALNKRWLSIYCTIVTIKLMFDWYCFNLSWRRHGPDIKLSILIKLYLWQIVDCMTQCHIISDVRSFVRVCTDTAKKQPKIGKLKRLFLKNSNCMTLTNPGCYHVKGHVQSRVWHLYGFWHERISEYIRIRKIIQRNTRINIRIENIRIFKYIRHTLDKTGTSSVLLQSKKHFWSLISTKYP